MHSFAHLTTLDKQSSISITLLYQSSTSECVYSALSGSEPGWRTPSGTRRSLESSLPTGANCNAVLVAYSRTISWRGQCE